jgi:hypothetical protein
VDDTLQESFDIFLMLDKPPNSQQETDQLPSTFPASSCSVPLPFNPFYLIAPTASFSFPDAP